MYVCIPIFTRKSIAAKYTSLQVRKTFAYYVKESNYECAHKQYEQYTCTYIQKHKIFPIGCGRLVTQCTNIHTLYMQNKNK